jgi:hypothetical protein
MSLIVKKTRRILHVLDRPLRNTESQFQFAKTGEGKDRLCHCRTVNRVKTVGVVLRDRIFGKKVFFVVLETTAKALDAVAIIRILPYNRGRTRCENCLSNFACRRLHMAMIHPPADSEGQTRPSCALPFEAVHPV